MTIDLQAFLKNMISAPGLSGFEAPIRELIQETWTPLVDEIRVSGLGSLQALVRGDAPEPRPSLVLSAHMDAIGMMVTGIQDGFIRFTEIGGLDPRILPGLIVMVHGRQDLPGLIVQPPRGLLPASTGNKPVAMEYLFVDTGLLPGEVSRKVRVGDLISFAQPPIETSGETLTGHSLDNRASVAVVTECLEELQGRRHTWDVWALASAQEEETLGGAITAAFQIQPALAVVIDVTFGASPGSPGNRTFPLGKGPSLGWGPNIHPNLFKQFKELAESLDIPYHVEVIPRHSGTDAIGIQVVGEGIPCIVIGIPLRYMHTPVEMVKIKDITRAGRLIAAFIAGLPVDFMEKISWID
jgi:putative aminopeptidase FrvX